MQRITLAGLALTLPLVLGACSSEQSTPSAPAASVRVVDAPEAAQLIRKPTTVVIDVRTPAEFAAGHVTGARNLDVNSGQFQEQIAGLDRSAPYVVYCHSGNRSAAAVAIMKQQGFHDVADAGALADLAAAGVATSM